MTNKVLDKNRLEHQVTVVLSVGEIEAIDTEAYRLEISRAELIRESLFGTYSVKDVLVDSKAGKCCIIRLNLTLADRRLVDVVAHETHLTKAKLIREILYENI